jgi:hypothetical protein
MHPDSNVILKLQQLGVVTQAGRDVFTFKICGSIGVILFSIQTVSGFHFALLPLRNFRNYLCSFWQTPWAFGAHLLQYVDRQDVGIILELISCQLEKWVSIADLHLEGSCQVKIHWDLVRRSVTGLFK